MKDMIIPRPELQIGFAQGIHEIRATYLQEALSKTIETINLAKLDEELTLYVPANYLKTLAKHGFRGELLYPVPCLLESNPYLLGYYRLLLGFSQKEFYTATFGLSFLKPMEAQGSLSDKARAALPILCKALIKSATALADGIGMERLTRELLDDLTLLTIGPQLRGRANVKRGEAGIVDVFEAIIGIVNDARISTSPTRIELKNAAGRIVLIEFASDPDIVIQEEMSENRYRNIAIEVKGGKDFSNIHNQVGEAEKSHQKAKANGYVECWTVVNVDRIDIDMAKRESPSTNTFYRLSSLKAATGDEYRDFRERITSLTGIPTGQ